MGFLKRSRDGGNKLPADGPEQWAARAQEVDAEVKRQREEEPTDQAATESYRSPYEQESLTNIVGELSPEFLKFLLEQVGADKGKFLRVGDLILVGPAEYMMPSGANHYVYHDEFFERIKKDESPEFQARVANAQTAAMLGGKPLPRKTGGPNPDGVEDAGYFLINESHPGDDIATLKIGGSSGAYGEADMNGRRETIKRVQEILGPDVKVEAGFVA